MRNEIINALRGGSGRLIISLIGMSNCGKSYWSEQLAGSGFEWICCDDRIEQKLRPALSRLGFGGIEAVSQWMGLPHEQDSARHQQMYLDCEGEVMREVLAELPRKSDRVVIDTTGSVIYTDADILRGLKEASLMVHLDVPERLQQEMIELYFKRPKPTLWAGFFKPEAGETPRETLVRCYPELLKSRLERYAFWADCSIDCALLRQQSSDSARFLDLIAAGLGQKLSNSEGPHFPGDSDRSGRPEERR